ncbi:hypothetical protein D3C87_1116140 [compost metagenome]
MPTKTEADTPAGALSEAAVTTATDSSEDVQAKLAPLTSLPSAASSVAFSVSVPPATGVALLVSTTTLVAAGVGCVAGAALSSEPQAVSTAAASKAMPNARAPAEKCENMDPTRFFDV